VPDRGALGTTIAGRPEPRHEESRRIDEGAGHILPRYLEAANAGSRTAAISYALVKLLGR
jgi:hypothetical protein